MIGPVELARRFDFHPATTAEKRNEHTSVRSRVHKLALDFDQLLPDGREKSTAVAKLEEAMFWANASLARP